MAVIMEPSMRHVSAIPWKAAYGPQVKKSLQLPTTWDKIASLRWLLVSKEGNTTMESPAISFFGTMTSKWDHDVEEVSKIERLNRCKFHGGHIKGLPQTIFLICQSCTYFNTF
jgi:hypothetical protein